ncbi:NAD(P)/FAD-dependent oxidoreductase [Cellulophaga sp. E16_2]|uniref:dihydrolipoyl dehydrogenase family protein n=1 Tax=Cellulophaga sp. E16_2 TaxID=2789297 RepID=UPI001A91E022|nr:NAD(P)/FAD-dependent oxidoreductase [Cellulophaga sp. E16_2]MBO0591625.1 NAD(P)/FAD-dependent oxidoreductase [Cellulophaga sp. E16_2]
MANKKFDVFVIGSGSAGQAVAKTCAKAGLHVAITERRDYGGTCPLRGCDPKKALLAATEVLEFAKNMNGNGIVKLPRLLWSDMQKFKKKFTKPIPKAAEESLVALGVVTFSGEASFLSEDTMVVGDEIIEADKFVIATGLMPLELPIEGAEYLKMSDDFLNLKKLPEQLVFVGGGYIGMEFAHMAARAGAKVTVIHSHERPLNEFDPDLVDVLTDYSKKIGIKFILNAKVNKVKKGKKKFKVHFEQNGQTNHIKANMVFNTAGRVPAIAMLEIEKANVAYSAKGIEVNEYLQNTKNKNVYACGDVSEHGLPLTSMTGPEANTVSANILEGNKVKINTPVIPSVVYTLPNIASVGYSEEEAKKRYKNVTVNHESATDWFNARRINAPVYAYKVLVNERTKAIVGAHIIGPHAGETINLFSMAIRKEMTIDDMKEIIFTYPSWGYDVNRML